MRCVNQERRLLGGGGGGFLGNGGNGGFGGGGGAALADPVRWERELQHEDGERGHIAPGAHVGL